MTTRTKMDTDEPLVSLPFALLTVPPLIAMAEHSPPPSLAENEVLIMEYQDMVMEAVSQLPSPQPPTPSSLSPLLLPPPLPAAPLRVAPPTEQQPPPQFVDSEVIINYQDMVMETVAHLPAFNDEDHNAHIDDSDAEFSDVTDNDDDVTRTIDYDHAMRDANHAAAHYQMLQQQLAEREQRIYLQQQEIEYLRQHE